MTKKLEKSMTKLLKQADLKKIPPLDHAINAIMAAVSAIRIIGGPLASLINSYIPRQKEKRLLNFIGSLSSEVDKIKDKIRIDLIDKDEFAYIFEKTFKGVLENYQEEKIECYKAILINSLIDKDSLSGEEKEVYLNILNNLTERHIRILAIIKKCHRGDLFEKITEINTRYKKEDILYIMDDLRSKGLVPEKSMAYSPDLTANFNQLSKMGEMFIRFISL